MFLYKFLTKLGIISILNTDMKKVLEKKDKDFIKGSRVSISVLIDYIKEGYSLSEFLSDYPWIRRSDAQRTLDQLKDNEFPTKYAF